MRYRATIALACVATFLTSCAASPTSELQAGTSSASPLTSPTLELARHDPPKAFDRANRAILAGAPDVRSEAVLASEKRVFFVGPESVTAFEFPNRHLWTSPFLADDLQRSPSDVRWFSKPALSQDGTTLFVASQGVRKGSGTTHDTPVIVLQSLDVATGRQRWRQLVDVPSAYARDTLTPWRASAVGEVGGNVVFGYRQDIVGKLALAFAVGRDDGQIKWSHQSYPSRAAAGRVIGVQEVDGVYERLVGLDSGNGKVAWSLDETDGVTPIGLWRTTMDVLQGSKWLTVDVVNGKILTSSSGGTSADCFEDSKAEIVVCSRGIASTWSYTDKVLWKLPQGNRSAVAIASVYGGLVYAKGPNGPVIIDGRTGEDVAAEVSIAPSVVTPYAGVVYDKEIDAWVAYPTSG